MERRLHWTVCAAACALVAMMAVTGCTSPGTTYGYLDVKIVGTAVSTPVQPAVNQTFSLGFTIRNTNKDPQSGITYRVMRVVTPDPLTLGSQIGSDVTVAIPAYGSLKQDFAMPAETVAGSYSYAIVLDPDNTIAERNETNNTTVSTVAVADLDIAFGTPEASVDTPPVSGDLTLHFVITNTANAAGTLPSAAVSYVITLEDDPTPIATTSATPASPATVATGASVPVTVTVPRPTVGRTYTITLGSSVTESSTTNNTAKAIVPVAN